MYPDMRLPSTVTLAVPVHPVPSTPVTVYVAVADGVNVAVPHVQHDNPVDGDHEYVTPPLAARVTIGPQVAGVAVAVIEGASMVIVTLAITVGVVTQGALLVISTAMLSPVLNVAEIKIEFVAPGTRLPLMLH
jgi:hypothetical protein